MKHRCHFLLIAIACALSLSGCGAGTPPRGGTSAEDALLVGAWRSQIHAQEGPLAEMKELEFLYSYNAGGTMTESSNYDEAANSSPPAYGVWRRLEARKFETKYVFFTTRASSSGDGAPTTTDWWPDGHGELTETITIADDGQTYASTIRLTMFDRTGAPVGGVHEGTGAGRRIGF
jgi:hypothetical protein